jgi:tetratricopeptide (TPR) repeat protein
MVNSRVTTGAVIAAILLWGVWPASAAAPGPNPDRAIAQAQWMVTRNPRDARAYHRLGDAYIQKARESGDITYFRLAEDALRKALGIEPQYGDAARHLAYALYSRHDFEGAIAEARRAIELSPADGHAHGILGDAYQEIGRYREARAAYARMMELWPDLYSYCRLSGAKSLQGDPGGAIEDLHRAIELGRARRHPPESVAWAQWQLAGEQMAIGNLAEAEARNVEALESYPNYHRALAGLAEVRAAQRRYSEAIDLYRRALAIIPMPGYAAALGDLYAKTGGHDDARKQYELVEYIGRLNSLNKVLYNRELAYFYADHDMKLADALALAAKELEARRDIYAHDVLAWALYKNGRVQEAVAPMQEALTQGTRDARLFFHAGMIAHALGNGADARKYLERALATNPHFHIFQADAAERTLRELAASSETPSRGE